MQMRSAIQTGGGKIKCCPFLKTCWLRAELFPFPVCKTSGFTTTRLIISKYLQTNLEKLKVTMAIRHQLSHSIWRTTLEQCLHHVMWQTSLLPKAERWETLRCQVVNDLFTGLQLWNAHSFQCIIKSTASFLFTAVGFCTSKKGRLTGQK